MKHDVKNTKILYRKTRQISPGLFKLLSEWKVLNIATKITGKHRRAPEGTCVPGGGIEIPCTYFLYGAKIHKKYVRKVIKECRNKVNFLINPVY